MKRLMKKVNSIDLRRNQVVYLKTQYLSYDDNNGCYHIRIPEFPLESENNDMCDYYGDFYVPLEN